MGRSLATTSYIFGSSLDSSPGRGLKCKHHRNATFPPLISPSSTCTFLAELSMMRRAGGRVAESSNLPHLLEPGQIYLPWQPHWVQFTSPGPCKVCSPFTPTHSQEATRVQRLSRLPVLFTRTLSPEDPFKASLREVTPHHSQWNHIFKLFLLFPQETYFMFFSILPQNRKTFKACVLGCHYKMFSKHEKIKDWKIKFVLNSKRDTICSKDKIKGLEH